MNDMNQWTMTPWTPGEITAHSGTQARPGPD